MQKTIKPINGNSWLEDLFFNKIWSYERFNAAFCKALDNRIIDGFAKGMQYVSSVPWTRLVVNRLVGTYEMELLPFFQSFDKNSPTTIFDIGAAEGYYAVGSLVRWQNSNVYAWEMDADARAIMKTLAAKNKVKERLQINETCTTTQLERALNTLSPELIIMDIEGEEVNLCSEEVIKNSQQSSWVIECHSEEIVTTLHHRFSKTHEVEIIKNRTLSYDDVKVKLPWVYTFFPQDRWRVVREGRVIATPWLIAKPKIN